MQCLIYDVGEACAKEPARATGVPLGNKMTDCNSSAFKSNATQGNGTQQKLPASSRRHGYMLCSGALQIVDAEHGNTADKDGVAKKAHLGPRKAGD
jgi:hypothetical protein